jgi:AcrR family transcriptional regulator
MTRKQPKEERLEAIVRAAAEEFIEKGYENASMDGIARRAGLTKGGVYHHFRGKDEILVSAARTFTEPIEALLAKAASGRSAAGCLRKAVRAYLTHWGERPVETAFFFLSMIKAQHLSEMRAAYEGYAAAAGSFYSRIFARGIEAGEFRLHDPDSQGLALAMALDGAAGALMVDESISRTEMTRRLIAAFVDTLAVESPGSNASKKGSK